MGAFLGVLVMVGAAAVVLPRVLRKPSAPDGGPASGPKPVGPGSKSASLPKPDDSPSRRFAAVNQRVGGGVGVPPEPLRDAKNSTEWKPEVVDSGFHQTTAYPEPPARYEAAEEQSRSGSRPVAPQPPANPSPS